MMVLWLEKKLRPNLGPVQTCLQIIFVSKFIFSTATHQNFFILHIMKDNNDIQQIQVISGVKKNSGPSFRAFQTQILSNKFCPKFGLIECSELKMENLNFFLKCSNSFYFDLMHTLYIFYVSDIVTRSSEATSTENGLRFTPLFCLGWEE